MLPAKRDLPTPPGGYSARDRVADHLCLTRPDHSDQDWEFTVDPDLRNEDLVTRALAAYGHSEADDDEREVLFDIIVDVINEHIAAGAPWADAAWDRAAGLVREHPEARRGQIAYWASADNDLEDAWAVAPRARRLYLEVFGIAAPSPYDRAVDIA